MLAGVPGKQRIVRAIELLISFGTVAAVVFLVFDALRSVEAQMLICSTNFGLVLAFQSELWEKKMHRN